MHSKTGVLIVNLGTPSAPTKKAIRHYLKTFLSDPRVVELPRLLWWPILYGFILPFRPKKLEKMYQAIWQKGGSPLFVLSKALCHGIQDELGAHYQVELAMSYGEPNMKAALTQLQSCSSIIVLPLYPQYSGTTTATVFDQFTRILQTWRAIPRITFINQYADHKDYIQALTQSIHRYIKEKGMPEKIIFSFHGLPQRCVDLGDPYETQCRLTTEKLTLALNLSEDQWMLTFQSRLGRAKWLAPDIQETLLQYAQQGIKHVAVICPGFAVDCLETLEEIAIRNRELFLEAGGETFDYIPALNDSTEHARALSKLVQTCMIKKD